MNESMDDGAWLAMVGLGMQQVAFGNYASGEMMPEKVGVVVAEDVYMSPHTLGRRA